MTERVAIVTGTGRGVGKGIACALGAAGWTVYVTGRGAAGEPPLSDTARTVTERGGTGVALQCDHRDDAQVQALIERAYGEQGRLDLLVNNVWAMPPDMTAFQDRFWERPVSDWDSLIGVGLRAHYVASVHAAKIMVKQGSGLLANISSFGSRGHLHSVLYGMSKTALDKMAHDMGHELTGTGVTAVSLWLGLMRTEALVERGVESVAGFPLASAETPEYVGRVLNALATDSNLSRHNGHTLVTAEVGVDYGITDEHGAAPPNHRAAFGGGPFF